MKSVFRSIISSLCGEIIDSMVFLPLLYLAIGGYGTIIQDFFQLLAIVIIQGVLKTCVELFLAPLVVNIVGLIRMYEKKYADA